MLPTSSARRRDGVAWITINRPEVRNAFRTKTVADRVGSTKGPVRNRTAVLASSGVPEHPTETPEVESPAALSLVEIKRHQAGCQHDAAHQLP